MNPQVAVIIVNWNGKEDTLECLASLAAATYSNKQVIVVDNGSSDGAAAEIARLHPDVVVLQTGENLGFTGGNNRGIAAALADGAEYVFLLNNDTTVDRGALAALVSAAENEPRFGILTPVIHYYDKPDEPWFAGSTMDLARGIAVHDNSRLPQRSEAAYEIPWASGCAMLIPADLIGELGGFDDRYYLNWEDVDLSLRARLVGKSIAIVPASRIYHKVGRSFARRTNSGLYYAVRNNLLFASLHSPQYASATTFKVVHRHLRMLAREFRTARRDTVFRFGLTICAIMDHLARRYGRGPAFGARPAPKTNR